MPLFLGMTTLALLWPRGIVSIAGGVDPAGIGDRGRGSDIGMSVVKGVNDGGFPDFLSGAEGNFRGSLSKLGLTVGEQNWL